MADPVLVIGEALIDIIQREEQPPEEHVGGSPANVALGLGRLGVPVRLRTALGSDDRGERIAAHLGESGVEVEPESFVLDRTATATARITAEGNAHYEFDIDWRIGSPVALRDARVVHVGSIGCFIEPGASVVRETIRSFAGQALVTFDPNIRPALVGERTAAVQVTEEIASRCDLIKLSDEDAAWLYAGLDVEAVLGRLLSLGARVVALTRGSEGSVLASRTSRATVESRRVIAQDTVGAGDTFMAALVGSLAEGRLGTDEDSLREAGENAALAASITVSRRGADLPTRADLAATLDRSSGGGRSGIRTDEAHGPRRQTRPV